MRTGWYQRYRNYYAEYKKAGLSNEEARNAAIQRLKEEQWHE
jgi:lipase chaperone LimK